MRFYFEKTHMEILIKATQFILSLSFLIVLHELGHFIPAKIFKNHHDDTVICRCEEVKMGEIRDSVSELGAEDSRTAKLFTRAGMGLCQGRICSRNVSEIVAGLTKCAVTDEERIASSNRPIAAPIALGLLGDGKM